MKLVVGRWCEKCQAVLGNVDWEDHELAHNYVEAEREKLPNAKYPKRTIALGPPYDDDTIPD